MNPGEWARQPLAEGCAWVHLQQVGIAAWTEPGQAAQTGDPKACHFLEATARSWRRTSGLSSESVAGERVVAAQLHTVAVEAAVFLFRALFKATGDGGVALGVAEEVGEADTGGSFVVVGFAEGREEVAHVHAAEGRLGVGAVEFKAGVEKELLREHHVAAERG